MRRPKRLRAAGLLPALLLGGLTVAGPFSGTSASVASQQPVAKPAAVVQQAVPQAVLIDPTASAFLVQVYLGIAALAVAVILFAVLWLRGAERREHRRLARASAVWTDALTTPTGRSGRSPARAPRGALVRS